jgi:hypothetical protein
MRRGKPGDHKPLIAGFAEAAVLPWKELRALEELLDLQREFPEFPPAPFCNDTARAPPIG